MESSGFIAGSLIGGPCVVHWMDSPKGRFMIIAPEGRYTLAGGLEEGGPGAAYLALKAKAPIIPIALTGTENASVYGNLRRLKRAKVTLTVGQPFHIEGAAEDRKRTRAATLSDHGIAGRAATH